jgi:hypothetical protein
MEISTLCQGGTTVAWGFGGRAGAQPTHSPSVYEVIRRVNRCIGVPVKRGASCRGSAEGRHRPAGQSKSQVPNTRGKPLRGESYRDQLQPFDDFTLFPSVAKQLGYNFAFANDKMAAPLSGFYSKRMRFDKTTMSNLLAMLPPIAVFCLVAFEACRRLP